MTDTTPQPVQVSPEGALHVERFRRRLPDQVRLHETLRSLGDISGQQCLEFGSSSGAPGYYLRRKGGTWHTVVVPASAEAAAREVLGDNVCAWDGKALPFEKQTFDTMVILDHLETVESDEAFIEDCHRVLKQNGRLIVNAWNRKRWMMARPLRRMLGVSPERLGMARDGYTESELFRALKHGFDVTNVRTYSRFFVEMTDVIVQSLLARAVRPDGSEDGARVTRILGAGGVCYRLAYQLDLLLFMTRGHYLVATAKRRAWRPRHAPVLVDGRSISEAVLTRTPD